MGLSPLTSISYTRGYNFLRLRINIKISALQRNIDPIVIYSLLNIKACNISPVPRQHTAYQ